LLSETASLNKVIQFPIAASGLATSTLNSSLLTLLKEVRNDKHTPFGSLLVFSLTVQPDCYHICLTMQ
jgi:hypothetical protein